MPAPVAGETQREFIARCMSDYEAVEDFPESDQRLAFCFSKWEESKDNEPD
jgi:hypothetical protein